MHPTEAQNNHSVINMRLLFIKPYNCMSMLWIKRAALHPLAVWIVSPGAAVQRCGGSRTPIPPGNAPALHASHTPRSASLSCLALLSVVSTPPSPNSSPLPHKRRNDLPLQRKQQSFYLAANVSRKCFTPVTIPTFTPTSDYLYCAFCKGTVVFHEFSKAFISPMYHKSF